MGSDVDRPGSESGNEPQGAAPGSTPGCRYAIRVEGLLDDHWSQWLDGMTMAHEEGAITRLEGPVIDQAALHGLLNKLRDLRLPIVTVQRLSAGIEGRKGADDAPLSEQPPKTRRDGTSWSSSVTRQTEG
jgi:hypothetical protein